MRKFISFIDIFKDSGKTLPKARCLCATNTGQFAVHVSIYAWCVIKNKNIFDLISQKRPIFKKNHKVKN